MTNKLSSIRPRKNNEKKKKTHLFELRCSFFVKSLYWFLSSPSLETMTREGYTVVTLVTVKSRQTENTMKPCINLNLCTQYFYFFPSNNYVPQNGNHNYRLTLVSTSS